MPSEPEMKADMRHLSPVYQMNSFQNDHYEGLLSHSTFVTYFFNSWDLSHKDTKLSKFHLPSWGSWGPWIRWTSFGSDDRWTSQRHRTGGRNESLLFHFTICTFLIPLQSVQKTQRKTCSESFCWRIWSYSARTCSTRSAHIRSAETKFNLDFADQLLKLHSWKALPIMLICLRVKIGLSGFVGVAAATAGALADELLVPACQSKGVSAKRTDNSTENLRKALPAFESLCQKYHTNFFYFFWGGGFSSNM